MINKPLVVERAYKASPQKVWQAITDVGQMRQWYFSLDDFKPEVGFKFRFTGESDCGEYMHLCEVTEVEPGSRITYSWRYEGFPGMSYVTWELFPDDEGTLLVLTHSGLESFPDHKDFTKDSFTGGWNYFLNEALLQFLEK